MEVPASQKFQDNPDYEQVWGDTSVMYMTKP